MNVSDDDRDVVFAQCPSLCDEVMLCYGVGEWVSG